MHTAKSHPNLYRNRICAAAALFLTLTTASFTSAQNAASVPPLPPVEKQPSVAVPPPPADPVPTDKEIILLDSFRVESGFRGSLAAAAQEKQSQKVITEVIHAEDIGKLPDISIAESLSRLPGLTTQRLNGRAQAIVIRGLNGDFSTALLNGRQQVSTNSGRSVEFDQYPAELLNNVVVYKATDAALVGQGLSGTVDLQTLRPLSHPKRTIAASAFYEWTGMKPDNADAKRGGLRETFSYIDQFANRKIGFAIGISNSNRPGQGQQFNSWGYDNGFPGGANLMGGAKPFVRTSEIGRQGYMAVIEVAPSANFHSTIDLYYSDFEETQLLRGIEIPLSPNWGTGTILQPGYTVDRGLITQATLTNFFGVVRNDFAKRNDHLFASGWNLEFGNKDGWKTDLDLSYSRVKRRDFVLETYSGYAVNGVGTPDTITYNLAPDGGAGATFTHQLDYSDGTQMRLGMPQGWGQNAALRPYGQHGFVKGPVARDEIIQYKLGTQHPLKGLFSRFEVGAVFNRRNKYETESGPNGMEGYFLQLKNGAASAPLPPSVGVTDLSFIGLGKMYSYDPMALYNSGFYDKIANDDPTKMANNWSVAEKVSIAYVKLDIDTKMGSIPISGNIGAQVVQTNQRSNGQAIDNATLTINQVSGEHKYTDFVPSLNLNFHLTEKDALRLSIARQLARQPMNDMRAGSTYSFDATKATSTDIQNSPWSANGGNPKLEPWRSNSVDLSFEHYFKDHMGYFSIAAFYKKLASYTYNQKAIKDFTGLPWTTSLPPAIYEGYSTIPQNGQGGMIKGLELAVSIPGEKFADFLKGFGVIASASFFKSSVQPDLNNPATSLVGLSDRVRSFTVYYERGGFSTRMSARYRSSYRGDIATFGPRGAVYRNLQPETVVDAQVSYTFKKGALKNLSVILQAYNLTDEPLNASSGADTRFVQDYQKYGVNYSLGTSYKF
ncbi:MAG: TonB-dependent receptor [Verrucomicrobia bacterium]|nr:TonB-dependent receptor [Verrucomicrobiota bacterium]